MSKNETERLRDLTDSSRRPRGAQTESERTRDEARELSDEERFAAFRKRKFQHVLPDPPTMPGYHCCWLSTENGADTIADRQQLGYELVTWAEVRGWGHANANVGAQESEPVRVREMVLGKIAERYYREYMHINHHERPAYGDEAILSAVEDMKARSRGKTSIVEEEGIDDIRSQMNRPSPFR